MRFITRLVSNCAPLEGLLAVQNVLTQLALAKSLENHFDKRLRISRASEVCYCHLKILNERCLLQAVIHRVVRDDGSPKISTSPKGVDRWQAEHEEGDYRDELPRILHLGFSTLTGYPAAFMPE